MAKNITVITSPILESGITPLKNFLKILGQFSNLFLISSNNVKDLIKNDLISLNSNCYFVRYSLKQNYLSRVFSYFSWQMQYSIKILGIYRKTDIFIFFIGDFAILPILICKILKKPVILLISGSFNKASKFSKDFFHIPMKIISCVCHHLSSHIVLYSPILISDYQLNRSKYKILIAHRHFLDFNTFTVTIPFSNRLHVIGYIGRLSGEKGIQNFIRALPAIMSTQRNFRALIGGDGQLKEEIETSLQENGIAGQVNLSGWISHDDLPKYLNQLQLLVLPSYTEGLPNIMLEAMACGTPVLATPVGSIPDVIRDGETGFIMEDNSPECIARNVLRVLSDPDLEGVAERGRRFVEGEYTFEKAVERWRQIFNEL